MSINKNDIQFYFTNLEPDMDQNIPSQSIGGYISKTLVYPETLFSANAGLYETTLTIEEPTDLEEWNGIQFFFANGELIESIPESNFINNSITVQRRGVNGLVKSHKINDKLYGIHSNLFTNSFNDSYKQYRCIAIKNNSIDSIAYNTFVSIYQNSLSRPSSLRLSLEIPKTQFITGTSTSWTSTRIIDTNLTYLNNNDLQNAFLTITSGVHSGLARVITSFDAPTGTMIFSQLPESNSAFQNMDYTIEPSPAQRLESGIIEPVNNSRMSSFVQSSNGVPISINILNSTTGGNLYPNDVIYLWIERYITKGSDEFENNSLIINLKYSTIGGG